MISRFLVYICGDLGSLSTCLYLLGGFTPFREEKEEQQRQREHILYLLPHLHPHTGPSFAFFHCHVH